MVVSDGVLCQTLLHTEPMPPWDILIMFGIGRHEMALMKGQLRN